MKIYSKGITHGGKFHADDVFSTAMLRLGNPEFTVKRVFEVPGDCDDCIVYDIGRGKFDHHGEEILYHENGKPFASFGLLWREYGLILAGSEKAQARIDESFISVIDDADNGGENDLVSMVISAFNPPWNSDDSTDEAFAEAVDFAEKILVKLIRKEKAVEEADDEVYQAYNDMNDNVVILKRYAPWMKILVETDAEFVVYPSMRGGYNIQGVPINSETRELKVPFPSEWCGLEKEELCRISGINGMEFCHRSGFLVSAETIESCIAAASEARKKLYGNNNKYDFH